MAGKLELDKGFEEIPLDEGFQEVPLTPQPTLKTPIVTAPEAPQQEFSMAGAFAPSLETAADFGRGVTQGITLGGSDEAIGALKALGEIATSDKSLKDWKDLYRKYQQQEEEKVREAEQRSPVASLAGNIAGGILPAIATAGATAPESAVQLGLREIAKQSGKLAAAKELGKRAVIAGAQAAPLGAVYGGLSSEGKVIGATPEELQKEIKDTSIGALTGGVFGAGVSAAAQTLPLAKEAVKSKIGNYIDDSPFFRQVKKAKELGEEGYNVSSDKAKYGLENNLLPGQEGPAPKPGLISKDTDASRDLVNRIYQVDDQLGQKVGKAIDTATDKGVTIDLKDEMLNSVNTFKNMIEKDQTLMANPKAKKLYDTIFNLAENKESTSFTPKEIQSLRTQVVDFSDSIKQKDPYVASLGYNFQRDIGNTLKEAIPEYKIAAERFESFRRLVPETLISGSTPVDISGVKLGNLKNGDAKLFDSAKNMLQGAMKPGHGAKEEAETYVNFLKGLKQFEAEDAQRVKQGLIKQSELPKMIDTTEPSQAKGMEKLIRDKADESAMLQQVWGVNPQEGPKSVIKGAIAGISSTGRGVTMNMANKYGLYKDTLLKPMAKPVKLMGKLNNFTEEQVKALGQKLSETPGVSSVGKALLDGLENKDQAKVNAAIFSIMQNPQARILLNDQSSEFPEESNE